MRCVACMHSCDAGGMHAGLFAEAFHNECAVFAGVDVIDFEFHVLALAGDPVDFDFMVGVVAVVEYFDDAVFPDFVALGGDFDFCAGGRFDAVPPCQRGGQRERQKNEEQFFHDVDDVGMSGFADVFRAVFMIATNCAVSLCMCCFRKGWGVRDVFAGSVWMMTDKWR